MEHPAYSKLWPLIALPILTIVVFANALSSPFVFDDQAVIFQDPKTMNTHTFSGVFTQGKDYRELLSVSYRLNYYLGGLNSFGYHVLNVIIHTINVLLVYWIILAAVPREPYRRFIATAGAAVFSVHTIFTGAVNYIAGRSSLLCATFYFLGVLLFLRALESPKFARRLLYFLCAGLAGFLAWETKQEAVTLPLFLGAIVVLRSRKNWRWMIPLVAIAAGLALIVLLRPASSLNPSETIPSILSENRSLVAAGSEKVLPRVVYFRSSVTAAVYYYFPRFVFPVDLSIDPEVPVIEHIYDWKFLSAILVLCVLAYLMLRLSRCEPLLSLALAGILVSPLLARSVVPLADIVLEHHAYIPGLGAGLLFAWLFQWIARHYYRFRWFSVGAVTVVLALMTVSRNKVWASSVTLWEDAVAKAPTKQRPHVNLGQAYQEAQRIPEAIDEYKRVLALKPDTYAAISNLAGIYLDRREYDKSETMLLKVTSMSPDFADGFINLGALYVRKGENDKAIAALDRAISLNPNTAAAHFNKGEALSLKGDFKAAVESYKEAVRLRPDLPSFRLALGEAYVQTEDRESAKKEFLQLTHGPFAPEALRDLGMLYRDAGKTDEAIKYLEQAIQLRFVFPGLHHDLGILYLQKKMMNLAIDQFKTTLQQQPDYGPAFLNLALAHQMKGENEEAKQVLQQYIQQYDTTNSPYISQARARLDFLSQH